MPIIIYTLCKSHVNVNHLHLHIWNFYTYTNTRLHRAMWMFVKYIYTTLRKCFGACKWKWIYYIPLMTIPSCKSILTGCGCISKLIFYLFLQWTILICPSQKIMILWYPPNISIFYQYGIMVVLFQEVNEHFSPSLLEYNFYY